MYVAVTKPGGNTNPAKPTCMYWLSKAPGRPKYLRYVCVTELPVSFTNIYVNACIFCKNIDIWNGIIIYYRIQKKPFMNFQQCNFVTYSRRTNVNSHTASMFWHPEGYCIL